MSFPPGAADRIRRKLEEATLPRELTGMMFAGYGDDQRCDGCETLILSEIERRSEENEPLVTSIAPICDPNLVVRGHNGSDGRHRLFPAVWAATLFGLDLQPSIAAATRERHDAAQRVPALRVNHDTRRARHLDQVLGLIAEHVSAGHFGMSAGHGEDRRGLHRNALPQRVMRWCRKYSSL